MSQPMLYMSNTTDVPNKLALWAMILGIVALVLSLAVIGGALGLAALIVGIFAVIRPGRKGMAITGITTGALALPIAFIALFFWVGLAMGFTSAAGASRRTATSAEIANLKSALDTFEVDNSRYPSTAEGLDALVNCPSGLVATWNKQLDSVPLDRWSHPFEYQGPDTATDGEFNIISAGPDGVFGTPDDIDIYTNR
jgi:general secretion pathway protein G